MKKLFFTLLFVLFPVISFSQEVKILIDAVSVRDSVNGEIVRTLNSGEKEELFNVYGYWGKVKGGWLNLDYTDYSFPDFSVTAEVKLSIGVVLVHSKAETDSGEIELKPNDVIFFKTEKNGKIFGLFNKKAVAINLNDIELKELNFKVVNLNRPVKLFSESGEETVVFPGETVLFEEGGKVLYKNHLWASFLFTDIKTKEPSLTSLEEEINHLIDIFNSAKYSSPISERIGYYVKLLPVDVNSFEVLETPTGLGLKIRLKYQFFYKDGKPVKGRKTRFILKKSNFNFWKTISELCFRYGVNKFVEIEVYRFNGENDFEKEGFIASSYHYYKENKLSSLSDFINNSESEFSNDLWFFADEVYERLENGD
ncbi:MAG: hypothetical protein ABGX27_04325 [Desulfurobacteriaceae bacterium]